MLKTKEKILAKSLELLNKQGVKETTLRQIASGLGMSQGNLNYHFKTKNEIIEALYFQLVAKIDVYVSEITQEQPIFSYINQTSLASMQCFYEYRFLMVDLYKILAANSKLQSHFSALQKQRTEQFLGLFGHLKQAGLMRPEEFDGEYQRLYARMHILGDNWVGMQPFWNMEGDNFVRYAHGLLNESIYPYLTKEGKKEYLLLMN
jgi:AcrR family transcriptional regulator